MPRGLPSWIRTLISSPRRVRTARPDSSKTRVHPLQTEAGRSPGRPRGDAGPSGTSLQNGLEGWASAMRTWGRTTAGGTGSRPPAERPRWPPRSATRSRDTSRGPREEDYGEFPPDVMLPEIRKLPRYQVEAGERMDRTAARSGSNASPLHEAGRAPTRALARRRPAALRILGVE